MIKKVSSRSVSSTSRYLEIELSSLLSATANFNESPPTGPSLSVCLSLCETQREGGRVKIWFSGVMHARNDSTRPARANDLYVRRSASVRRPWPSSNSSSSSSSSSSSFSRFFPILITSTSTLGERADADERRSDDARATVQRRTGRTDAEADAVGRRRVAACIERRCPHFKIRQMDVVTDYFL